MPDPILPGQPVPVVPRSQGQAWRRFLALLTTLAGAGLQVIHDNAPQIVAQFPGVKWMGGALFLAGLAWSTWQRLEDAGNVTPVNLSGPADGGNQ